METCGDGSWRLNPVTVVHKKLDNLVIPPGKTSPTPPSLSVVGDATVPYNMTYWAWDGLMFQENKLPAKHHIWKLLLTGHMQSYTVYVNAGFCLGSDASVPVCCPVVCSCKKNSWKTPGTLLGFELACGVTHAARALGYRGDFVVVSQSGFTERGWDHAPRWCLISVSQDCCSCLPVPLKYMNPLTQILPTSPLQGNPGDSLSICGPKWGTRLCLVLRMLTAQCESAALGLSQAGGHLCLVWGYNA